MPNILHINSYFTTNRLHAELVRKLDRLDWKQTVFVPVISKSDIGINNVDDLENSTIEYKHCFNKVTRHLWPLKMWQIWINLKKLFHQIERPDIVHAHTLIVNGIPAYLLKKKYNIPYVVTVRNTDINLFLTKYKFFRKIAWKVLRESDSIITLSPAYGYKQLSKFFSESQKIEIRNKLFINPNGVNDFWQENRSHSVKNLDAFTLLFVGRVDRNKNLSTFIRAGEILTNKGFKLKLSVVGDGYLLKSIQQQEYITQIEYHGHVKDRSKLLQYYRNSHILVVPSFTESFGLVYAEAMTQGLPVIYTKGQGFDGFFEPGEVGFAVDVTNPENVADYIEKIISNYNEISKTAYENSTRFSWEVVIDKLTSMYNKTLNI